MAPPMAPDAASLTATTALSALLEPPADATLVVPVLELAWEAVDEALEALVESGSGFEAAVLGAVAFEAVAFEAVAFEAVAFEAVVLELVVLGAVVLELVVLGAVVLGAVAFEAVALEPIDPASAPEPVACPAAPASVVLLEAPPAFEAELLEPGTVATFPVELEFFAEVSPGVSIPGRP